MLTPAEIGVILQITLGLTDESVAVVVHLSPHTVRHHVASAMRRTGARSRTHLVALCFGAGVLLPSWPPRLGDAVCLCPTAAEATGHLSAAARAT
jgi:DNA-binding CsgD family transcriptional regulator